MAFTATRSLPRVISAYSTLADVLAIPAGAQMLGPVLERMAAGAGVAAGSDDVEGARAMLAGIQLSSLVGFGMIGEEQLEGLIAQLNAAQAAAQTE